MAAHRQRAQERLDAVSQPVEVTDRFSSHEAMLEIVRVYQVDYGRQRRCSNFTCRRWQSHGMLVVADVSEHDVPSLDAPYCSEDCVADVYTP